MEIKKYIQNQVFSPRIKKNSVLVVYDPERIYHDVCLDMTTDTIKVIVASNSSITSREEALKRIGKRASKYQSRDGGP